MTGIPKPYVRDWAAGVEGGVALIWVAIVSAWWGTMTPGWLLTAGCVWLGIAQVFGLVRESLSARRARRWWARAWLDDYDEKHPGGSA